MGNGVRVQSGMTFAERPATSLASLESSGPGRPPASSHFSRATSTPPVFSAPASEPPTQAIIAGVNAGAFPALVLPRAPDGGVGEGLFRMAK